MKLPEPSCPFGYTTSDVAKILTDDQVLKFTDGYTYQTCTGKTVKSDRKSKLQTYRTVCADNPHGQIWSSSQIKEFLNDEDLLSQTETARDFIVYNQVDLRDLNEQI